MISWKFFKFLLVLNSIIPEKNLLEKVIFGTFNGDVTKYADENYPDMLRSASIAEVVIFYLAAAYNIDLNEDFYITSLLFESGILFNGIDKNLYAKYIIQNKHKLLETNKLYLVEADLIKSKIYNEIVLENILKNYYNDFEMKKIIKTYLECNMNISKASTVLYMHRNTLMYKIDNFISVTGFDIKNFKEAFIIYHII